MEVVQMYPLLFLLTLVAVLIDNTHSLPANTMQDQASSQPEIDNVDAAMKPIYTMTTFFLESVLQTQTLKSLEDEDFDLGNIGSFMDSAIEHWDALIWYLLGFVVCTGLGVLMLLCMCCSCLWVPCCRCCGKCGGKVDPAEISTTKCKRCCCGVTLFLFTTLLALAAASIFVINGRLQKELVGNASIFDTVDKAAVGTEAYLWRSYRELDDVAQGGFHTVTQDLFDSLDNISTNAVAAINNATEVLDNFGQLQRFVLNLPRIHTQMSLARDQTAYLVNLSTYLDAELKLVISNITDIVISCLTKPCNDSMSDLDSVEVMGNFTGMGILFEAARDTVNASIEKGIITTLENVSNDLNEIPKVIDDNLGDPINDTKRIANDIDKLIGEALDELSDALTDLDLGPIIDSVLEVKDLIEPYVSQFVYWGVFGLGMVLSLICVCNLIGLLHDVVCRKRRKEGVCCGCNKSMGGHWLLMGVGCSFFFYWLLALIVILFFLLAGLTHTEACRHLVHHDEPKSQDVLAIFDAWIVDMLNSDLGVGVFQAYNNCAQDQALFMALNLESTFNLSELIDLSAVKDVIDDVKNIPITIAEVEVLPGDLNATILTLASVLTLDYTFLRTQVSTPMTSIDLNRLAGTLANLSDISDSKLQNHSESLRRIYSDYSNDTSQGKMVLNATIGRLEDLIGNINLNEITGKLARSGDQLNANGNEIIETFVNDTADSMYDRIVVFSDDLEQKLLTDVGRCRPLYDEVSSLINQICVDLLWPLNAIWFSLGWCIFFIIPSIIISFKLVTIYRKSIPYNNKVEPIASGKRADVPMKPLKSRSTARVHPAKHGSQPGVYNA